MNRMPIIGYEGYYEADELGNIYSISRLIKRETVGDLPLTGRRLAPKLTRTGYHLVSLTIKCVRRSFSVHRLVLGAFSKMPDAPNNMVNHKNGVKTDNNLSNLEWCNRSENAIHSYEVLKRQRSVMKKRGESQLAKPVMGANLKTGELHRFDCMTDAVEQGFTISGISSCVTGKQKTHRDCIWSLI